MPINPMDIIGQLNNKPLDFGNPLQDYAQVQNLRHLMLQGNEQERLADENQRASNVLRQSGGDLTQALPGMIKEGLFTHAQTIQKALDAGALHKSTMDLQKSKIGEQDSLAAKNKYDLNEKMLRDGIDHISKFDNPTDALADIDKQVKAGTLPPEKAMSLRASIPEDVPTFNNVWKPKLIESMMSMADRYKAANPTPQVIQEKLGTTNVVSTVEPKSGVKKVISTSPIGVSPDAQARIDNPKAAQNIKPPAGYAWGPVDADGQPTLVRIKGGPADEKANTAQQKVEDGMADVNVSVSQLRDAYDRLEKGGGITSTKNGALANASAYASSTGLGQLAGKALGTANQSARNDIAMSRPTLLAAIMKATGMSAKQMDSNTELKLWLTTATDPTLDIQANRNALDNIEKKYLRHAQPAQEKTKAGATVSNW